MPNNIPFSPLTILRLIAASLPPNGDDQPQLKSPQDAVAIFTHACMLSVGFRLVGFSEDDRLETTSDESDPKPLPAPWNSSTGSYGFRYANSQSSMQYLIKVNRLGGKTVIMGLGLGDDKTASFEIVTKDFTSESFFPYTATAAPGEQQQQPKRLEDGFISEHRIVDLANSIKISIVQKLVPGIIKPGYEEEHARVRGGGGEGRSSRQSRPDDDPLRIPRPGGNPYGGFPRTGPPPIPAGGERIPGFDDEYEILQPPRGAYYPGRNPLSIGEDDLNPPGLGPNPPLRGPFFGEGGGMSGMHPTPDHPMFGGRGGSRLMDPRAPPGSRYDPVGPGDEPPTGGLRGPRGPGGPGFGGGGPPNQFSGYGSGDFM